MPAILGTTIDNQSLTIGDMERRSGLYILGKPTMGKSWLLINLLLQDQHAGHGIFFIDPHGEAITEFLHHAHCFVLKPYILLDPEDETYSFGINLLECHHLEAARARNETFARAKGGFDKLWKNSFEEKPWLQHLKVSMI